MLALRLDEYQGVAPQVLIAVHDCGVVAAAHVGRAGDRKRAGCLANVNLNVHDGLGAVASRGNAWILKFSLFSTGCHIGRIVADVSYSSAAFGYHSFSH